MMEGRKLLCFLLLAAACPLYCDLSTFLLSGLKREEIALLQYDSRRLAK